MKRQVLDTCRNARYISLTQYFGTWADNQVPNTYSHYSDIAMETLMLKCQPIWKRLQD